MDLRHTVGTIFSLTLDLILKPRQNIFTVSRAVFNCQLAKDPHKYFIHEIDLTSLESDNQESNRYLFQGKEKMAWELNFTILLYDKTTCISSFVKISSISCY